MREVGEAHRGHRSHLCLQEGLVRRGFLEEVLLELHWRCSEFLPGQQGSVKPRWRVQHKLRLGMWDSCHTQGEARRAAQLDYKVQGEL